MGATTLSRQPAARKERRIRFWSRVASALIFALAVPLVTVARHLPQTNPRSLVDIEFAPSADTVRALVPAEQQPSVLRARHAMSWFFVPSYWALFSASALVLLVGGRWLGRVCGIVVLAGITLAALCDVRANALIASAVLTPGSDAAPHVWATAKWLLFFVSAAALGPPLLTSEPHLRYHANTSGGLFLLAGILAVHSIATDVHRLTLALALLVVALVLLALLFLWEPDYFGTS